MCFEEEEYPYCKRFSLRLLEDMMSDVSHASLGVVREQT